MPRLTYISLTQLFSRTCTWYQEHRFFLKKHTKKKPEPPKFCFHHNIFFFTILAMEFLSQTSATSAAHTQPPPAFSSAAPTTSSAPLFVTPTTAAAYAGTSFPQPFTQPYSAAAFSSFAPGISSSVLTGPSVPARISGHHRRPSPLRHAHVSLLSVDFPFCPATDLCS